MPFGFGAKRSHAFLIFAPFSPGFQPWETSNKAVRPERARDGVGEMPFECYKATLRRRVAAVGPGRGLPHDLVLSLDAPKSNVA